MSLSKSVTFKGITVNSCIIEVGAVSILEDHETMSFVVNYKAGEEYESFDSVAYSCVYDITGADPITQAYAYLKTLDDFSGATEV